MEQLWPFIGHHWVLMSSFLIALSYLIYLEKDVSSKFLNYVSPTEAIALINEHHGKVIDLREIKTFKTGHIVNAVHINASDKLGFITKRFKNKQTPLILIGEKNLFELAQALHQAGYEQITTLKGGLKSWREAKMPLISE